MSYELDIADEAFADLERLIESLPEPRRAEAIDGIQAALLTLTANPMLAGKQSLGRPTYRFRFTAGGVGYHWAATFAYSADETRIIITHVYRIPL